MNHLVIALLLLLISSGCAGSKRHARYDAYLSMMKGRSVDQLMNAWGTPVETTALKNGNRLLIYVEQREAQVTKRNFLTGSKEKKMKEYSCTTSFEVGPDNIVNSYTFEGNGCGSKKLKAKER